MRSPARLSNWSLSFANNLEEESLAMRIVVMGTGGFAVPTFKSLVNSDHDVLALITRPPHGRKPPPNPMKQAAEAAGVAIEMPASVNSAEAREYLTRLAGHLFVVCDYGQILSAETLALASLGGINLHGSLLPAYRGAAPVNWAIYDGCTETGVTVIHMTPRLDAGPCLVERRLTIGPHETAIELEHRLADIGVEPVNVAIDRLSDWDGESEMGNVQNKARATRAPRLKKTDGNVDWRRSAGDIYNQVRAFKPWPGTYTFWHRPGDAPLRLVLDALQPEGLKPDEMTAPPGTVIRAKKELVIATGDGTVRVEQLYPSGKRAMDAEAFLRGYCVAVGERFGDD